MRTFFLSLMTVVFAVACGGPQQNDSDRRTDKKRAERVLELSKTWPDTPDYSTVFVALSPHGNAEGPSDARAVFDSTDYYGGLPRTGAYEFVAAYCSGCHSLEIVMQQRASRERWSYMLTWMVEKQGMVPLDEQDEDLILDYLVAHFGP